MFTNIFAARATRAVAVAAAIGLAVIAIFELLLALGVPWGRAAWGGSQEVLSPDLRMASAVAVVVWVGAALLVLGRAGYWASARCSCSVPCSTSPPRARGSASAGVRSGSC